MRMTLARLSRLVAADVRLVARDALLSLLVFVPFMAAAALRFIFPALCRLVEGATAFRLSDYAGIARVVIILFPGMFYGTVSGFLLLDDRDDGVSAYWGATPVGRPGYLVARLGLFSLLAFAAGAAAGPLFGLGAAGQGAFAGGADLAVAALGATQVAAFGLALAALAANKVEGLALVKALGVVDVAPLAVYLPLPLRGVAWAFPQYWAAELVAGAGRTPSWACLALGLGSAAAWIIALYARYRRRVE